MRTAVIGAGSSGLSLALLLDDEVVVFEAADRPGGWCASEVVDGWTFDRGRHVIGPSNGAAVDFAIGSLDGDVPQRRCRDVVAVHGSFVRLPIESDLASLPLSPRVRSLLGFLFNDHRRLVEGSSNLYEWTLATFGAGLTDLYFQPYYHKRCGVPLSELPASWLERLPRCTAPDVVRGALGIEPEGLRGRSYYYPVTGGFQALPSAWAGMLPGGVLRLSTPVISIAPDVDGVQVTTSRGSERFDRVIATAPLPAVVDLVEDVPEPVVTAAQAVQINALGLVNLGFPGPSPHRFTGVLLPDPEYLAYRVSYPSVLAPSNSPVGCFSVQAEISVAPGGAVLAVSDDTLVEQVWAGLRRHGLIRDRDEPCFTDVQRYPFAHPVSRRSSQRHVRVVTEWLARRRVQLFGPLAQLEPFDSDTDIDERLGGVADLASELNGRPTRVSDLAGRPRPFEMQRRSPR